MEEEEFERFKKWTKENISGILVVAKKGARATSKFEKAVANVAKKVGPIPASLLNLITKALTWGAKGVAFLAKNLWILALALTNFLYNEYGKRKRKK